MALFQSPKQQAIRQVISDFIQQRLTDKLDKLSSNDPKRDELQAQYQPDVWLTDAARRVGQLQMVTHTLKAVHPDAKGSSLYLSAAEMAALPVVGSHCLGEQFASDVVGNAAALDVYKFLKLDHNGQPLLSLMQAGDDAMLAALSDDPEQAQALCDAFTAITQPKGGLSSHSLAKQVYWLPPGQNPADDDQYHLLAPLYASALAQQVYPQIQASRFGEEAKAARQARREGKPHPHGYSDYPWVAKEKKGGTKPQNISQLNSERKGSNYLLASLPPVWELSEVKPVFHSVTVFNRFGRRKEVRRLMRAHKAFLESNPPANVHTRDRTKVWLDNVFEELYLFSCELIDALPVGWSADTRCRLPIEEQCWLDPWRTADDIEFNKAWQWQDWPELVASQFGRWVNGQMGDRLLLGDDEFRYWARTLAAGSGWRAMNKAEQEGVQTLLAAFPPDELPPTEGDDNA